MGEFQIDKKRVESCIEYNDYYSAMHYSLLVKKYYNDIEKEFFENIIELTKLGKYL